MFQHLVVKDLPPLKNSGANIGTKKSEQQPVLM